MATTAVHGDGCGTCGFIHAVDEPCPEPGTAFTEGVEVTDEAKEAYVRALSLAFDGKV